MEVRRSSLDPIPALHAAAGQLALAADSLVAGDGHAASSYLRGIDQEPLRRYWNSKQEARNQALSENVGRDAGPGRQPAGQARSGAAWDGLQVTIGERDGWYCRYCDVPVVSKGARMAFSSLLPSLDLWPERGKGRDSRRHQALVVLHASLDHVEAAWTGGLNEGDNLVMCCAVCQFSKMGHSLEALGLANPLDTAPVSGSWDGLQRLVQRAGEGHGAAMPVSQKVRKAERRPSAAGRPAWTLADLSSWLAKHEPAMSGRVEQFLNLCDERGFSIHSTSARYPSFAVQVPVAGRAIRPIYLLARDPLVLELSLKQLSHVDAARCRACLEALATVPGFSGTLDARVDTRAESRRRPKVPAHAVFIDDVQPQQLVRALELLGGSDVRC